MYFTFITRAAKTIIIPCHRNAFEFIIVNSLSVHIIHNNIISTSYFLSLLVQGFYTTYYRNMLMETTALNLILNLQQ